MTKSHFMIGVLLFGGVLAAGGAKFYLNADDAAIRSEASYIATDTGKAVSNDGRRNSAKDAEKLIPFPLWVLLSAANYPMEGVEPVPCPIWLLHNVAQLVSDKD